MDGSLSFYSVYVFIIFVVHGKFLFIFSFTLSPQKETNVKDHCPSILASI